MNATSLLTMRSLLLLKSTVVMRMRAINYLASRRYVCQPPGFTAHTYNPFSRLILPSPLLYSALLYSTLRSVA